MEAGRIRPGAGRGVVPPPPATPATADPTGGGATSLLPRPDLVGGTDREPLARRRAGMRAAVGSRGAGGLTGELRNGLADGLGLFFKKIFTPLTEAGKEIASVKVRLTMALAPRRLFCPSQ
jgi:hypothetical protein